MQSLSLKARKQLGRHQEQFVEAFDSMLGDVVHDLFMDDPQLRRLAGAWAETEYASIEREDQCGYDDVAQSLDEATGKISWALEQRAYERIAELCEMTVTDVGEWTDVHSEEECREAATEAREWLGRNTNAAERAGVDYGEALPSNHELFKTEVTPDA